MPRKIQKKRIKYLRYKDGLAYVVKKIDSIKHPVWRRCYDETEEGVRQVLAELGAAVEQAKRDEQKTDHTLGEYLAEWLAAVRPRLARRTFEDYAAAVDKLNRLAVSRTRLLALRPMHLQTAFAELRATPNEIKKLYKVLRSALRQAVAWEILDQNPCRAVVLPKYQPPDDQEIFTEDEARRFIELCRAAPDALVLEFALETSMRPEEYLAISWKDIDLKAKTATVTRAVSFSRGDGGFQIKDPKSRAGFRTIAISATLAERLKDHKKRQDAELKAIKERINALRAETVGKSGANHRKRLKTIRNQKQRLKNHRRFDLVFPNENFEPVRISNLSKRVFKPIARRIRDIPLKNLRHTGASILARRIPVNDLQKRLGHSQVTTTLKYYVHVEQKYRRRAADEISDAIYK